MGAARTRDVSIQENVCCVAVRKALTATEKLAQASVFYVTFYATMLFGIIYVFIK